MFRPLALFAVSMVCAPLTAQLKDWQVVGRFQVRSFTGGPAGSDTVLERTRFWTDGFVHPKVSVRFQYEFVDPQLKDLWVSYHPSPDLRIRFGQSWLPFIGDFTTAPFFLDTIDFTAAARLWPARERGLFVLGQHKDVTYSASIVNGNGSEKDENSWKDVFGFVKVPVTTKRLLVGFGHYEGRAGPDGSLTVERRTVADFESELTHRLTLKGAYVRGRDAQIASDGAWLRTLVRFRKTVDLIGEYDTFIQGLIREKYFTGGVNYHFPFDNTHLKVHFRRFYRPQTYNELKVQLQVFLQHRWRPARSH